MAPDQEAQTFVFATASFDLSVVYASGLRYRIRSTGGDNNKTEKANDMFFFQCCPPDFTALRFFQNLSKTKKHHFTENG